MLGNRRCAALAATLAVAIASAHVSTVARAEPTAADFETARELYKQGKALRAKGDLPGALGKFKAAHALAGTPVTGVELGRTHMQLGNLVEARDAFLAVGRMPSKPTDSANLKQAHAEAEQLANDVYPKIPSLTITVTGVPAGMTVEVAIDGVNVPNEALSAARRLNPGKHHIAARVGTGKEQSVDVELKESEAKELKLAIPEDALPPVATGTVVTPAGSGPSGAPSSGSLTKDAGERRNYTLSTIGFGVAGAGLLVGSITGIIAINKAGDLKSQCENKICPLSLQQNIDSSKRLGTISSISFALAGVGTAVAIIGLILPVGRSTASSPSRPGVSPWIGLGIAGVEGRF